MITALSVKQYFPSNKCNLGDTSFRNITKILQTPNICWHFKISIRPINLHTLSALHNSFFLMNFASLHNQIQSAILHYFCYLNSNWILKGILFSVLNGSQPSSLDRHEFPKFPDLDTSASHSEDEHQKHNICLFLPQV